MSVLTTKEKLDLVLDLTKKHEITAYEIGNKTELDSSAVHRILTGDVKKPRDRTLSIILEYIEDKITGKDVREGNSLREEKPPYENKNAAASQNSIQSIIAGEVKKILSAEFANIGDAIVNNHTDLDEIKEDLEDLKEKLKQIHKLLQGKKTK